MYINRFPIKNNKRLSNSCAHFILLLNRNICCNSPRIYYVAESEALASIGLVMFVRLSVCLSVCPSVCPSVRPSVNTITQKRVDRFGSNLGRSLWSRARSLLIFSPLGQTPRSKVKVESFQLCHIAHLNSAIESSCQADLDSAVASGQIDLTWSQIGVKFVISNMGHVTYHSKALVK